MSIPSIPRGPERAWTTCRAGAAISGLFRSDYAPENVQALPPGMTAAEYDALSLTPGCPGPGGPSLLDNGCENDCLARYVPWVEQGRTPDFAGGDPALEWTRGKGWEERPGCVAPEPSPQQVLIEFNCGTPGDYPVGVLTDFSGWWLLADLVTTIPFAHTTDANGFFSLGFAPVLAVKVRIETAFNTSCGGATGGLIEEDLTGTPSTLTLYPSIIGV